MASRRGGASGGAFEASPGQTSGGEDLVLEQGSKNSLSGNLGTRSPQGRLAPGGYNVSGRKWLTNADLPFRPHFPFGAMGGYRAFTRR